jgi:hypothetical protein
MARMHPPAAAALAVLLAACGDPAPLALLPSPVRIGYDAESVHGLVPMDPDHDGDTDFVALLDSGLRYLAFRDGGWHDETPGTALEQAGPARRLVADGMDLLLERPDGALARLQYTGIGSWKAGGDAPAALPEAPRTVDADLDRDGRADRAELDGRRVRVLLRGADGALRDATTALGADALALRGEGRALFACDADGDGDTDLLAVAGRVMAWISNGGRAPDG